MKCSMALLMIGVVATMFMPAAWAESPPVFLLKWGTPGTGDGEFGQPYGVAVSPDGYVYVADHPNHRIQKFTSDGAFVLKWGASGSGDGQFDRPTFLAVDDGGNVFVCDQFNHRVQKFAGSGTFLLKWGGYGSADGLFIHPGGIAVDIDGHVYVTDAQNYRVQKFTGEGAFITKWGSYGSGPGQFEGPADLAVDTDGNVFVGDFGSNRIEKFTSDGVFLTEWGELGTGPGQFQGTRGVATDSRGDVYVAERDNHRIQKFSGNGTFMTTWGSQGSDEAQFVIPQGVAVDASGNIYVGDSNNYRIQKFGGFLALGMGDANLQSDCLSSAENTFTVCVTVTGVTPDPTDVQAMKLNFSFDDAELDLLSIDVPGGSIWGAGSDYVAFTSTGAGTGEINVSSLLFGGISVGTGGTVCCLTFERKTGAVGVIDYEISAADIRDPLNDPITADLAGASGSVTRILGDFTTTLVGGATNCGLPGFGPPDGDVDVFDLGVFSNHFGAIDPAAEYCCIVDVGPTTTSYIFGEPTIDGLIDFEDLIIFSISFGYSFIGGYAAPAPAIIPDAPSQVRLVPVAGSSGYVVEVELSPATGVQALHAVLDYDPSVLRFVGAEAVGNGSFLGLIPGERVDLNLAALGVANAWTQTGSVARLTFERVGEGSAEVSFASLDLRSSFNERLAAQGEGVTLGGSVAASPATLNFLAPANPNPFATTTTIDFSMAVRSEYSLTIHDVTGRLVRSFSGSAEPGANEIVWDGRDNSGRQMSSGLYFYRLKAGVFTATKTVVLAN